MLFTEPFFLFVFLPLTLACYYAVPQRFRNTVLALASLVFYSFGELRFLLWLVASVAVNYWIARGIETRRDTPWARRLLVLGVASDLALLVVFKYAGFIVGNVNAVLGAAGIAPFTLPEIRLPLGISFFTFHKISYKVDVYRGTAEAKKTPTDLALYILVFPQLIAGPIVRYYEIAGELARRVTTRAGFAEGVRRFVVGLGKKMIVANTVAYCADRVFAIPVAELTAPLAWLGVVCYALQIYFDFSGYSDMAIGLARMFGFHFPENFDHPYTSASITEFWRRWHMSLSRWFRDYLYVPLGGNRRSPPRVTLNLAVVFLLCGLWHGASWTFVVWGAFHGALLGIERAGFGRLLDAAPRVLRHGYTLAMVLVGWVFFRAETLPYAAAYIRAMSGLGTGDGVRYYPAYYLDRELIVVAVIGLVASAPVRGRISHFLDRTIANLDSGRARLIDVSRACLSFALLSSIFVYSVMSAAVDTYNPFIYFRF